MTSPNTATAKPPGAPAGNGNALRTGLRSDRLSTDYRVGNSSLPPDFKHQQRAANEYRRGLEWAVVDAKGSVSLIDAHHISTATRAERACLALLKILRDGSDLSATDRAAILEKSTRMTERRDAAVAKLGIDIDPSADPWANLYPSHHEDFGGTLQSGRPNRAETHDSEPGDHSDPAGGSDASEAAVVTTEPENGKPGGTA